jgi:regulator of replication initiation timing
MSQPPRFDQLKALIDVNNDLRRELDAANKLIKELFEENDKLVMKLLNAKHKGTEQ